MKYLNSASLLFTVSIASGQTAAQDAIKKLDRQWLVDTYFTGEMANYDAIVATDFKITHSNGDVLSKSEKRADILANKIKGRTSPFKMGQATIQIYGGTAVSIGTLIERNRNVRFTNTYVKKNGRWQVDLLS